MLGMSCMCTILGQQYLHPSVLGGRSVCGRRPTASGAVDELGRELRIILRLFWLQAVWRLCCKRTSDSEWHAFSPAAVVSTATTAAHVA